MTVPGCAPRDLTKEKSLWAIYKTARRIPTSGFNKTTTWLIFLLLCLHCWISEQSMQSTIDLVRRNADMGLTISLSTLGLLLAGFTIFSTVTQPALSLQMAETLHKESGLSWLKHNYFVFVRVFVYFLSFATFCLLIIMFGHKDGLLATLVSFSPYEKEVTFVLVKASYVIMFTGYYFLLIQLKSFVYNIYHAVMTSLRWRAEGYDDH